MIFSGNTRVYIYTGSIDMRNSIDGLSAKVKGLMNQNPFTGDLFVFSNRYHNMIKILYWHTNGFCLWMKRLERGRFKWPSPSSDMCCSVRYFAQRPRLCNGAPHNHMVRMSSIF